MLVRIDINATFANQSVFNVGGFAGGILLVRKTGYKNRPRHVSAQSPNQTTPSCNIVCKDIWGIYVFHNNRIL